MQTNEAKAADSQVYRIEGLTCTNCAGIFERNVQRLPGVEDARVNFGAAKLRVYGAATVEELEAAGAFEGLKITPDKHPVGESKPPWWRAHQGALASAALTAAAYGLSTAAGMGRLAVLLFAAAIAIGGWRLLRRGAMNLVRRQLDMNALMTLAVLGACAIGDWGEGAVVVALFAASESLERYSMHKARESIRILMGLAPKEALLLRNGLERAVPVEEVLPGDVMRVKPGQQVAMDGIILKGTSTLNQAAVTGESVPVLRTEGEEVYAGTWNGDGLLEVRVTKRTDDTAIARIIHLVEEAQAERAPSQTLVDRFARVYTPVIMGVAASVAVVPPLLGADWGEWIYRGLSLLVVGCPCALVISTPIAIVTAIGHAARHGVLIKGGLALEEAGRLAAVALDKTGTLTEGRPEITELETYGDLSDDAALALAAALERGSHHPLAEAIVRQADRRGANPMLAAEGLRSIVGVGVRASIGGLEYGIGNERMMAAMGVDLPLTVQTRVAALQAQGRTVMLLASGGQVLALLAAADAVRASGPSVLRQLEAAGIRRTVMLTGDQEAAALAVGRQLGLAEVRAGLLPEEKLAAIRELRAGVGPTAMVGDGINDAPALAAASVGIAMGGAGTDAAMETADIVLMADDLRKLPYTIRLSRRTLGIIRQNVALSLGLKVLALALIVPGWLTLWLAILADMGATLLVTLNSLRLLRTQERE